MKSVNFVICIFASHIFFLFNNVSCSIEEDLNEDPTLDTDSNNRSQNEDANSQEIPHSKLIIFDKKRLELNKNIENLRKERVGRPKLVKLNIDRNNLLETSYKALMDKDPEDIFLNGYAVKFTKEIGDDAGGLKKDWLDSTIRLIFDKKTKLFIQGDYKSTAVPLRILDEDINNYFRFLGRLMGILVMSKINADVNLDLTVYKQILNQKCTKEDFIKSDSELYTNLLKIEDSLNSLSLVFEDSYGVEMVPEGSSKLVTKENIEEYIQLRLRYHFVDSCATQIKVIKEGFNEIIKPNLFETWTPEELKLLICGTKYVDVKSWEKNTYYEGFERQDDTIKWFWEILIHYDQEYLVKLLHFVTGSSQLPPRGFEDLTRLGWQFKIYKTPNEDLPRSSTCANILYLRQYKTKEVLQKELDKMIEYSYTGFHVKE